MSTTNLLRLVSWDIQLQARENVYAFTVLTTAAFAVAISLLPPDVPPSVVIAILYLDPAVVGTSFVGAMVLMERSQNTLPALAVTPLSPVDYVVSKIITLTGLTLAGALALVAVAWWPPSLELIGRMTLALVFSGTLGVLTGLALIATANSMNHFIARAFPLSVFLFLPFFAHFGVVDGWLAWLLFGINPGHAVLRALLWAADPAAVDMAEVVYAFGYMGLLIAVMLPWTLRLHTETIGRAA